VPEALHRLTEIYLTLGLVDQARKTAAVLGYNYPGSPWYSDSYKDLVGSGGAEVADGEKPPPQPGFFARTFGSIF
jgi:outer membrane protein assembly factor BamD